MNNFWKNVSRYPQFFITSVLGSILVILTPFKSFVKNPQLRIILALGFIILVFSLWTIINSMAGL